MSIGLCLSRHHRRGPASCHSGCPASGIHEPLDMMAARPRLHRRRLLTLMPLLKTLAGYLAGRSKWQVMITHTDGR